MNDVKAVAKMLNKSIEEVNKMIDKTHRDFKGLISRKGCLHIIAKEHGLEIIGFSHKRVDLK